VVDVSPSTAACAAAPAASLDDGRNGESAGCWCWREDLLLQGSARVRVRVQLMRSTTTLCRRLKKL